MSRARHMKKAAGGGIKPVVFAGEGSENLKEARERKKGGRVHHEEGEGEHAKHRGDHKKRARGGKVEHEEKERKHGGRVHDGHPKHHADGGVAHHAHMHKRASGGRIGANRMPLSTAATIKEVTKGEQKEDLGKH